MDPAEIEFMAENEPITIVPNFNEGILHLLETDVGPFKAGMPLDGVPMWMAVNLKQRQKCRIIQPDWMDFERLEEVKEKEKEEALFTEMPHPHLFVIANILIDVAIQDITNVDNIRSVINDIWDIRQAKLRKSVNAFMEQRGLFAKLDHLQLIELNSIRPLLPKAMDRVFELEKADTDIKRMSQSFGDRSILSNSTL